MSTENQATKVIIGPVRLSYAHIWEAKAIGDSEEKKFSTSIIIDKKDKELIKKIEAAVEAAKESGKAKWGGTIPKKLKLPLRDGDDDDSRSEDEAYQGMYFLNATSRTKPGIIDSVHKKEITDQSLVYSGCYVYVSLNMYPYDTKGNKGVAVGLNNIMKYKDGEPLAGRASAESDFADLELAGDTADDIL